MTHQKRVVGLLRAVWVWMLAPTVSAYFMGDSKAVLRGCEDRWTLQNRGAMPRLFRMTVCVHVRVVTPGAWVAFSYSSAYAPRPELGLEGDEGALYGWLLGVRHRFPMPLAPSRWQQVCLRRDVRGNTFSLHVDGMPVAERTVIAHAIPPSGSLRLGCWARDRSSGAVDGTIELYLFRVWPDLDDHAVCEDGSVIGWDSVFWGVTSSKARQRDDSLVCGEGFGGPTRLPASTSSPGVTMATTNTQDESQVTTALSVEGTGVTSTSINQQLPIDPTANTSEAPGTTTAPANKTAGYTSQPTTPLNPSVTMANSTNVTPSTTVSTGSLATVAGVVTTPILIPVSQAPPSTDTSTANQITSYTQAPPITAQPAYQIPPPLLVPLASPRLNCDITPFCTSDGVAHYWMLISVEAETSGHAETDVIHWASAVFGCEGSTYADTQGGARLVCQEFSLVQELQVSCEKEQESRCADCSVLMRFSHPVPVCGLQYQMIQSGKDLRICSTGQVERVGRGLCGEAVPSAGGFVRCSPYSSLVKVCQTDTPSHFNCSLLEPGTIRVALPERDLCSSRCGSPGLSARVLLGSSQVWLAGVLGVLDACRDQHPVICDPTRTEAVILTDSCPIPPRMPPVANQSMLLPSFLRGKNFTGFPEMRLPPLGNPITFDMKNATAGPKITTTSTNATTQHASLHSTPTPTVRLNTSLSPNSSLGLGFTTSPTTETITNATQTVNTPEVIQSSGSQTTEPNTTTLTESSSLMSRPNTTARSDLVETYNTTQTATQHTAPTSGNTTDIVTTIAPDTTTAHRDSTMFQNTTVVPDATTPRSPTATPNAGRSPAPSVRYNATTSVPFGLNTTTTAPRSVSTVNNHTVATATVTNATQTPRNGSNTTAIPGNSTLPVSMGTVVATDDGSLHSAVSSSPSNATLDATTASPDHRATIRTNHSAVILTNETTTGSVAMAANRETPSTVPTTTTTAALDTQRYTNWTETNNNTVKAENVTYSVATGTTNGSNPSNTSTVNTNTSTTANTSNLTTTTTTTTAPQIQPPLVNTTPSSTTGSHQHSTSESTRTPTTTLPTHHTSRATTTVATVTESLPLETTTTNTTDGISATTTGNISSETSEQTRGQEEEAKELEKETQSVSKLNSTQVEGLVGRLETLLDGAKVSQEVGRSAVRAISNLMEGDDLDISSSSTRLIHSVDQLALKLEVGPETMVLSASSLAMAVRSLDGTRFPKTSFSLTDLTHLQVSTGDRSRVGDRRSEVVLGSVFLPSSLLESLTPAEQVLANRVQFTFYTTHKLFQDVGLGNRTLVSPVLGSSVTNLSVSNLRENIHFSIRSPHNTQANSPPRCVFWDFSLNGGRGGWSTAGCFVLNATDGQTSCSCNHLTSFAILLDLSRGGVSDREQGAILTFITYIGCGVSAVFLSITLLTYLCFQKLLRDIPSKILVQLCLSLLLLNLLFLLDGWLALYPAPGLCISTAFFLHYFLLTSFTWAGLEALHMYLSIVRVFTPYLSRYMLRFSLLGWGVPLMVVVIIISVDKDNYGLITYGKYSDGTTDDFCWLRNDTAFYIGVVAYFLVIFTLCLVVFTVVLAQLARIKRQNPHNQSPRRGLITDLRSVAGLILLLGLTWGFALFAWGPLHLPFLYLFSIFNSLQGFFIFIFHCAVKDNVRRQWRTYLCCGRLRLAENSEWSRTATQNPKKQSVVVATSIILSPASRSSSLTSSEMTNSSLGSDSGISDSFHGDVVLNEIHRRSNMEPHDAS